MSEALSNSKVFRIKRIQRWIGAKQTGNLNDDEALDILEKDLDGLADHIDKTVREKAAEIDPTDLPADTPPIDGRIALVVGHWESNSGAETVDGESEWVNRGRLANHVADLLKDRNVEARVFYRLEGVGYRAAMNHLGKQINAFDPSFAIEFHFNAFDGHAHGVEMLYVSSGGFQLASAILKEIMHHAPGLTKRRGPGGTGLIKAGRKDHGYGFLTCCRCPCVLPEPGFFDNEEDFKYFRGEVGEGNESMAYADAIVKVLND